MEVFVGSESAGDYFNIQKSWCMVWWVVVFVMFCFERIIDWENVDCLSWLFVWLILRLIDEIVFRVCLLCFVLSVFWLRDFGLFYLIVWFDWLFRLVVFYWTVVILWERRKIKVWRCIAMLPLLNPMSKRVRSDSNGWSFDLGVYFLLWKRFLVLNVALRAAQVKSFAK